MRILVTGSRNWDDFGTLKRAILETVWKQNNRVERVTIVQGGARGADAAAESVARAYGLDSETYPAAWDTRGRAAGFIRNPEMVSAGADICLAFIKDQSRGATMCADLAEKAGIKTVRYTA